MIKTAGIHGIDAKRKVSAVNWYLARRIILLSVAALVVAIAIVTTITSPNVRCTAITHTPHPVCARTNSSDPWWVEIIYSWINIDQWNYPKVVQSKTKPTTGFKGTYLVTGVQGPFPGEDAATKAAKGYSGIINKGGVGSGGR